MPVQMDKRMRNSVEASSSFVCQKEQRRGRGVTKSEVEVCQITIISPFGEVNRHKEVYEVY